MTDTRAARERMVTEQVAGRGVTDARVLSAMRAVPREAFVPADQRPQAYEDRPLPIGFGQTISQPFIVARMAELAKIPAGSTVLEVGAGCGYAAAVFGQLAARVYAVEIIPELAAQAQRNLAAAGVRNVVVECRDGTLGWPEHEPYDVIIVSAGAPRVPALLAAQLADGGRLIVPVGDREDQRLVIVTRRGEDFDTQMTTPVRFVDLTGRYGWGGPGPARA